MKIIDTHIHIWNFSRARYEWLDNHTGVLKKNYLIEELESARTSAGISGGVLVQAANNTEDTDYMLEVAASTSWLQGVVGWLPLTDPARTQQLLNEKYLSNPYFKGVRHLIHDEPDERWLLQPAVIESLRILAAHNIPYDVVGVTIKHLETAIGVAEKVPELLMMLDHCNQPPIAAPEEQGAWRTWMRAAATHPQFHVKVSGLGGTAQKGDRWTAEDITPSLILLEEYFGENRICCGGDWPVCLLAGSYEQAWKSYKEVLTKILSESALKKVFYQNAERFYKLKSEV